MYSNAKFNKISNYLKILPIFLIFLTTLIISWIYIDSTQKLFDKNANESINNLYEKEKDTLRQNVQVIANFIKYKKESVEKETKEKIKQRIDVAFLIAQNIYEKNKGKKSDEEIKKEIINTLRNIIYSDPKTNTQSYYFIQEFHNKDEIIARLLPTTPDKEGLNRANLTDVNGFYHVKAFYEICMSQKEGFITYHWKKLKNNKSEVFPKLSYIKLFEPYNWMIGYGEYVDDMEYKIKEETIDMISKLRYFDGNYIFMSRLQISPS